MALLGRMKQVRDVNFVFTHAHTHTPTPTHTHTHTHTLTHTHTRVRACRSIMALQGHVKQLLGVDFSPCGIKVATVGLCFECDMTHSHVQHDAFIRVMTHSYVWHDSFIYETWLIHMCDMTHSYVWHDSFTRATWRIHTCDMTQFTCISWLIHMCDMTHSNVRHCSIHTCEYTYEFTHKMW